MTMTGALTPLRILLIDDEADVLTTVGALLRRLGHDVTIFEALSGSREPDCISRKPRGM